MHRLNLTTLSLLAAGLTVGASQAATITWEAAPTPILTATDIINDGSAAASVSFTRDTFPSGTATVVAPGGAINYGAAATVNGVSFADGGGSGPFFAATGDAELDKVRQFHAAFGNATDPWELTLSGLTANTQYKIQIIGIHDNRTASGISTRTTTYQDNDGGLVSPILTRGTGGSVIGTFTTGAGETSFTIDAIGAADPGAGGVVLRVVPEPGSLALLGLGGLMIARRRRD